MDSQIVNALQPEVSPVAVVFADEVPAGVFMIPAGKWGCVMWLLASAAKGKAAAADRRHFGCMGGGTGLGFGNQYESWPGGIECFYYFLSTGNEQWDHGREAMAEARPQMRTRSFEHFVHGERYLDSPERVKRFVQTLPIIDVPTQYVAFHPLADLPAGTAVEVVVFLVDPDRVAALTILAGFARDTSENVVMPQGAGCQSIGIHAYRENRAELPRAVLGPADISARLYMNRQLGRRDLMTFAVPWRLFEQMEANVEHSLLATKRWQEVLDAQK
jgi:uncharacterized protein (DUF169 family)